MKIRKSKKTNRKSFRQEFQKFILGKCRKKNGERYSSKSAKDYSSHVATENGLLGFEEDGGIYHLKNDSQLERKLNLLIMEGKFPYLKSQHSFDPANILLGKFLNHKSKK